MRLLRDSYRPVVHHLVVERDSEALIFDIIQATAVAGWLERLQESSVDTLVLNPKARKQLPPNLIIGGAFVVVDFDRIPMTASLPRGQLHQALELWGQLENGPRTERVPAEKGVQHDTLLLHPSAVHFVEFPRHATFRVGQKRSPAKVGVVSRGTKVLPINTLGWELLPRFFGNHFAKAPTCLFESLKWTDQECSILDLAHVLVIFCKKWLESLESRSQHVGMLSVVPRQWPWRRRTAAPDTHTCGMRLAFGASS